MDPVNPLNRDASPNTPDKSSAETSTGRGRKLFSSVGIAATLTVGSMISLDHYLDHRSEVRSSEAESMPVYNAVRKAAFTDHAAGVYSGMLISGVVVPKEIARKMEALENSELQREFGGFDNLRQQGVRDGMSGGWNATRLEAYVDLIMEFDGTMREIVGSAMDKLSRIEGIGGLNHRGDLTSYRAKALAGMYVASSALSQDRNSVADPAKVLGIDREAAEGTPEGEVLAVFDGMRSEMINGVLRVDLLAGLHRTAIGEMVKQRVENWMEHGPERDARVASATSDRPADPFERARTASQERDTGKDFDI